MSDEEEIAQPHCWLCQRELGEVVQLHHPVPKAKKGRVTVPVHPICHKTIHNNFTNAQLSRIGDDRDAILENEDVAKFVKWIADKPADFNAPTKSKR